MARVIDVKHTKPVQPRIRLLSLELSGDEAEALRTVLNKVGGDPDHSPRKHIDTLNTALNKAGVEPESLSATGEIYFKTVE